MKRISRNTVRRSVPLTEEADEAIDRLARQRGTSVALTLKDLIATGLTVEAIVELGGKVYGQIPDGTPDGYQLPIRGDGTKFETLPSKLESSLVRQRRNLWDSRLEVNDEKLGDK